MAQAQVAAPAQPLTINGTGVVNQQLGGEVSVINLGADKGKLAGQETQFNEVLDELYLPAAQ